jgi:hypothetical protein
MRHTRFRDPRILDKCIYCTDEINAPPRGDQYMYCPPGQHEVLVRQCRDEHGVNHQSCLECRARGSRSSQLFQQTQSTQTEAAGSTQSTVATGSSGPASSQFSSNLLPPASGRRNTAGQPVPGLSERQRAQRVAQMSVPDPTLDPQSATWATDPALNDQDWQLLQNFHRRLKRDEVLQTCSRCNERWFHMGLNDDNVCSGCHRVDKDVDPDDPGTPYLFSNDNLMDPGPRAPLEPLSQVEEMLIARVHTHVEVRQIRGQQYKYRGHVVNFLSHTAKVYNVLPLLPEDLDIIIVRPKNWRSDPRMERQFAKDYRVRRQLIKDWLLYLRQHHPAYHPSQLQIADENLDLLPVDAFVDDQLIVHELDDEEANPDPTDDGEADPEAGAVPDLHAENDEITELRAEIVREGGQTIGQQPRRLPHMSMPTPQRTPLSEFNKSYALLSWAFPTLYPQGRAEFVESRLRDVNYPEYIRHLLLHKDRRFAQHPRWRYVAFNTLKRKQVNTKAGFFVRQMH